MPRETVAKEIDYSNTWYRVRVYNHAVPADFPDRDIRFNANGISYIIQEGEEVEIPHTAYEALINSVERVHYFHRDSNGNLVHKVRHVPQYQVVAVDTPKPVGRPKDNEARKVLRDAPSGKSNEPTEEEVDDSDDV